MSNTKKRPKGCNNWPGPIFSLCIIQVNGCSNPGMVGVRRHMAASHCRRKPGFGESITRSMKSTLPVTVEHQPPGVEVAEEYGGCEAHTAQWAIPDNKGTFFLQFFCIKGSFSKVPHKMLDLLGKKSLS